MEHSFKFSNKMTNDSYFSNFKGVAVFSVYFWGLLSFYQITREGNVIYPIFFLKMEYSFKFSNAMTNKSYISNLKNVTVFSVHF